MISPCILPKMANTFDMVNKLHGKNTYIFKAKSNMFLAEMSDLSTTRELKNGNSAKLAAG